MSIEEIIMRNRFNDLIDKINITMSGDHVQKQLIIKTIENIRDSYKTKVVSPYEHRKIDTVTINGVLKTLPKPTSGQGDSLFFYIMKNKPILRMKVYADGIVRNSLIDVKVGDFLSITGCLKSPAVGDMKNLVYMTAYSIINIGKNYDPA
jgi:hypothetical protein